MASRTENVKCNGGSPTCQTCLDNGLQCGYEGYVRAPERLTLARAVKRIAKLEQRLRLYEGSGTDIISAPTIEASAGVATQHSSNSHSANATQPDDMDQLLRGVNHLTISKHPEFYGGSSLNAIIDEVESAEEAEPPAFKDSESTIPPCDTDPWSAVGDGLRFADMVDSFLPPRVDADGYVERYFQTSHKIYPVVERQSFMLRYDDFWLGLPTEGQGYELWVGILYMVLALGHQCSTVDPDPIVRRQALQCTDGEMCFLMARSTFADVPFCGGDLSAAISMFLGFIWLYNQQRFHESYAVLGAATRVGYAIGLHRQRVLPESQEVTHVKTLWWCLFIYETELATFSGRPCAIQPHEVDVQPFSLDVSPTNLQYIEAMRQFTHLTWEAYEKIYGLSYRYATLDHRIDALRTHDAKFEAWYDLWIRSSLWSREPYGLILRLRYGNIRILLHRAFLNLTILRIKKGKEVREELISVAAVCVKMAILFIRTTTESIHVTTSGIIQAALFHVIGYLWNATMTLVLYAKNMSIHAVLGEKGIDYQETIAHIRLAIGFFSAHQYASSTAQSAVLKIMRLMDRLQDNQHGPQSVSPQTTNDIGISMFDSPDQPLDFLSQLSDPTFIFADHSLPNYFSISPGKDNEQTRTTVWRGENEHQPFYGSLG